ncbi:MAG: acetaldehyde dehydrogenase (acetylating) [Candidatus Curtissbacteria bacterium]|nr:acetaldehyde dehydrogenase (acetylating) [Candidatus Curtissbacteria bacterium]
MSKRIKVGIIGTGNIGSDLLMKIRRSKLLDCGIFAGHNMMSEGIKRAKAMGVNTSYDSINSIVKNPDFCEIVFDATSAEAHKVHAPILAKLGKFTIDMTPSRVGKMCIPILNLEEGLREKNVNMVTCGGQATTPLVTALMKIHPEIEYVEIVASIASRSAGIGTRNNIDEYTQTTSDAIQKFTHVKGAKAIIILNPSEPPIVMHNTIFAKVAKPKIKLIEKELNKFIFEIRKYVPGYKLTMKPVTENGRLTFMNEVLGRGDFLPTYAGNLDIINSAAVLVAEEYAKRKI